jgi:hypothetical protein
MSFFGKRKKTFHHERSSDAQNGTTKYDGDAINQGRSFCLVARKKGKFGVGLRLLFSNFVDSFTRKKKKDENVFRNSRGSLYHQIVTFMKWVGDWKSVNFGEKPLNNLSKVEEKGFHQAVHSWKNTR